MAYPLIENLASKFSLSKEELVQEGSKAFLLNQLHENELRRRLARYQLMIRFLRSGDSIGWSSYHQAKIK